MPPLKQQYIDCRLQSADREWPRDHSASDNRTFFL